MLMNRALIVSKVLMWQGLFFLFFLLQLNYSHNYVLVASALKQTQSNNGNNICLSEWKANCCGVLWLVRVINQTHVPRHLRIVNADRRRAVLRRPYPHLCIAIINNLWLLSKLKTIKLIGTSFSGNVQVHLCMRCIHFSFLSAFHLSPTRPLNATQHCKQIPAALMTKPAQCLFFLCDMICGEWT